MFRKRKRKSVPKERYPLVLTEEDVQEIMRCDREMAKRFIRLALCKTKKIEPMVAKTIGDKNRIPRDLFFEVYGI